MNKFAYLLSFLIICLSFSLAAQEKISKIVWESPLNRSDFSNLIKVYEGENFSIKSLRRTVKLLYASKKFEQVLVFAEKTAQNELILTIKGIPQLVIKKIKINGNSAFSDREIKFAAGIGLNSLFFNDNLEKIRDEIIYFYRESGYFSVLVNIATERLSPSSVALKIEIKEGREEKIKKIGLTGSFNKSELRKVQFDLDSTFKNSPYTDKNINDAVVFATDYYKNQGYLDVTVNSEKMANGLLSLFINKGSLYRLEIEGTYAFSSDAVRKIVRSVPDYHFNLKEVQKKISIFYNAYGFHDAKIEVVGEDFVSDEEIKIIKVKIDERERRFVKKIVLEGAGEENRKIVLKRLTDFIEKKIDEEEFPSVRIDRSVTGGGYIDSDGSRERTLKESRKNKVALPDAPLGIPLLYFDEIRDIVEKVYQNRGYRDAIVSDAVFYEEAGSLVLKIPVKENRQYVLHGITAETGDEKLDDLLKKKIMLKEPIPFNLKIVEVYKERISKFLIKEGYIFNFVTHELIYEGEKVFIRFNAEYLFKVKATEVVIAGNHLTSTWVVRHILRIEPGDILDGDSFLHSRRNLLQTGNFQSVEIAFIDPETPNEEKDVAVVVSETERFKISPGIGISNDEGARLTGDFEWNNLLGSGVSTKLSFKFSRKIEPLMGDKFRKYYSRDFSTLEKFERKINLTFLFPDLYIPKLPLSAQIDAFHIHDLKSNSGLPYMIDKNGLYFSVFRKFNDNYFLSTGFELAYQYERDYEATESGDATYDDLKSLVISPEIRGYIDFRDSLFFPKKGWKTFLKYQNKSSVYGDGGRYSLIEGNFSFYLPLQYRTNFAGDLEAKDGIIFHSFWGSAFLIRHSGTLSSDDVLKLGGSATVRGFYNDELKPNDQKGKAAEGKFYLFMRNEFRLKLFIKTLYLVAFFDLGNLWEEITSVGEGALFRYASGGGLIYASPIGSIAAQFGFNIKPREGEAPWTFHLFLSTF